MTLSENESQQASNLITVQKIPRHNLHKYKGLFNAPLQVTMGKLVTPKEGNLEKEEPSKKKKKHKHFQKGGKQFSKAPNPGVNVTKQICD